MPGSDNISRDRYCSANKQAIRHKNDLPSILLFNQIIKLKAMANKNEIVQNPSDAMGTNKAEGEKNN